MHEDSKMINFREYVLSKDNIVRLERDMSRALDGRHPNDWDEKKQFSDDATSLLYKAARMFAGQNPEALMGFLDEYGDDQIKELIKKVKEKKGGLNLGSRGLGNIGGDDLEKFKTPDSDRAGSPEEEGGDFGGQGAGY